MNKAHKLRQKIALLSLVQSFLMGAAVTFSSLPLWETMSRLQTDYQFFDNIVLWQFYWLALSISSVLIIFSRKIAALVALIAFLLLFFSNWAASSNLVDIYLQLDSSPPAGSMYSNEIIEGKISEVQVWLQLGSLALFLQFLGFLSLTGASFLMGDSDD